MAKRGNPNFRRLPPGPAPPREMMMIHHPARRRKRNAGVGGRLMGEKSPIVPILAGAGGAVVAVVGADKLGVNPNVAAWGTAAAGAATALGSRGMVRQIATGVGAAGMCLGALQLLASAKAEAAKKTHEKHKRQAEGDSGFVTQKDLNDALGRMADQQKQGHCDLLTALRDEIRRVVTETKGTPADSASLRFYPTRDAGPESVDEYTESAYGEEARNAAVPPETADEYTESAYGADGQARNANGEEEAGEYADEAEAAG